MDIGERIRQRRAALHMTQEELAQKVGFKGKAAISKIEKGERDVAIDKVTVFAAALDCTPDHLMGWDELTPENFIIYSASRLMEQLSKEGQEDVLEYIGMVLNRERRKKHE